MLATARIPAATGTPGLSKGHKQEKAQPSAAKTPATAGSVCGKAIKVAGNEARNMALNVAMSKKLAVEIARSGSEGLQGSYRVGGGRGLPPPNHPLQ
jgi:hypothetical protein